jgi:hypothetical protein
VSPATSCASSGGPVGRRAALADRVSALSGPEQLASGDVADAIVEGSEVRRALASLPERDREALTLVA